MQIQRTIQTIDSPRVTIDLTASFTHQRVEILNENATQFPKKRRTPPVQFADKVQTSAMSYQRYRRQIGISKCYC